MNWKRGLFRIWLACAAASLLVTYAQNSADIFFRIAHPSGMLSAEEKAEEDAIVDQVIQKMIDEGARRGEVPRRQSSEPIQRPEPRPEPPPITLGALMLRLTIEGLALPVAAGIFGVASWFLVIWIRAGFKKTT